MRAYIYQHLGLGDMILCNGLVRHFLELRPDIKKFYIFCKKAHTNSIKFMYRDESRIKLIPVNNELKKEKKEVDSYLNNLRGNFELIKIGHEFYNLTNQLNLSKKNKWPCDIVFYKQFNVPFKFRFSKSFWLRDLKREKKVFNKLVGQAKNYVFVHADPSRNLIINTNKINKKYKIIENDYKYSIFDYCIILENAKELHLMESSFRQIVETLNLKKVKLYLYKGRDGDHSIDLYNQKLKKWVGTSKKWKIVKTEILKEKKSKLSIMKNIFKGKN